MIQSSNQPVGRPLTCAHKRAPNFNAPCLYTLAILFNHKKRTFHAPVCNRLKTHIHTSYRKSPPLPRDSRFALSFLCPLSFPLSAYVIALMAFASFIKSDVLHAHTYQSPALTLFLLRTHAFADGAPHKSANANRSRA